MARPNEVLVLVPEVTPEIAAFIKLLSDHHGVHAVIPSALDGLDVLALKELHRTATLVSTFAATPMQLKEKHLDLTIRAAVHYELGRVAIPVHYQNLRDQLEREYGLAGVKDSQVSKILAGSPHIVEVLDHVYKSKQRYRDPEPRRLLKHWCFLIGGNLFDGVYDLPAYCEKLDLWYAPMAGPAIAGFPPLEAFSFVQIKTADNVVLVRTRGRQMATRCISDTASGFFADAVLSDFVSDFISPLDNDLVSQLQRAHAIRTTLQSSPVGATAIDCLKKYAHLWMDYIPNQNLRGQEQKWRGWYLVPEHGPLTLTKLWELQRILTALSAHSESDSCLIDTSDVGLRNVLALLTAGDVKYEKRYSAAQKRTLFVRQQKNYLIRLGLVTEPAPSYLSVSDIGKSWISIATERELRDAYRAVLKEIRWTWCNMPFFEFTKEVARHCDGQIFYRELFNWVIHAYDRSQLPEVVMALRAARNLPKSQRCSLDDYIETKLRSLLDRHMSSAAFGHYRTKVRDLMEAFATTGEFVIRNDGMSVRLVLTALGKEVGGTYG